MQFISYTEDVVEVFMFNLIHHHPFADEKRLYRSGKISEIDNIRYRSAASVRELLLYVLFTAPPTLS